MALVEEFAGTNLRYQQRLACGLIPLLNLLRDHKAPIDDILATVGIRRFELFDPAFTISRDVEYRIVEEALARIHQPALSLTLARYYHLHNFLMLGLAMRACSTLQDVFALIIRYPRLVWGVCETVGTTQGETMRFELRAGDRRVERFLLERDMASMKTLFSEALGAPFEVERVGFSHHIGESLPAYEQFFGCPVLSQSETSFLEFNHSQLVRQLPTADRLALEFYEAQCARQVAELDKPFRYGAVVRDRLLVQTPVPDLPTLAARLGIEERTLQRFLKREGVTFSELLKEVRFRRAKDRLAYSRDSVESIALELGFNDAVAFSHAFKRWSGESPQQWRRTHDSASE